jgi:hypothetical protein
MGQDGNPIGGEPGQGMGSGAARHGGGDLGGSASGAGGGDLGGSGGGSGIPPTNEGSDDAPDDQMASERGEGSRPGGMDAPADDGAPDDMGAPGPDTERSGGSSNG